jgi:uncharacterized protein (TIGR00369 family)
MCFLCGMQNPVGLKLTFYDNPEEQRVYSEFVIPDEYQGYPGVVHGGIVAAVLDETAGRAMMLNGQHDNLFATLRLTIRYRHPTPTETPLTAVGWVEKVGGTGARVAGEIRLPDTTVTAECEALVGPLPEEFRGQWAPEKPYWRIWDD